MPTHLPAGSHDSRPRPRVRQGHPEPNRGVYHYHAASSCLDGYLEAVENKARVIPISPRIALSHQ